MPANCWYSMSQLTSWLPQLIVLFELTYFENLSFRIIRTQNIVTAVLKRKESQKNHLSHMGIASRTFNQWKHRIDPASSYSPSFSHSALLSRTKYLNNDFRDQIRKNNNCLYNSREGLIIQAAGTNLLTLLIA